MRRREFITLLGGAAAALVSCPFATHAQERMRRVGVLMTTAAGDPEGQARIAAFLQGLQPLGWTIGINMQIDIRFAVEPDRIRQEATQLAAIAPDIILTNSSSGIGAMLQATRSVPIVFAVVADPVGAGFVNSLSRPGGNATGFTNFEYGIGGKWLELLKEVRPDLKRAAVIRDPTTAVALGQFGALQGVAPSLGVEVTPVNLGNVGEIEKAIATFAQSAHGGLLILGGPLVLAHRDLIIALAAQHRLPAVYPSRFFTAAGGLISYGPDFLEQFRRAAGYVDRILKGEKPADLPVQAPTKYQVVINLKTAKALGLEVPPMLLARADEVIE
jgi:putative tryptophan/tyrosine transport system substrate-binding protein